MGMHEPVTVETWEWTDTVDDELILEGYDAEGRHVATRVFEFVETEVEIDGEWTTVEEAAAGDGASWNPDDPLGGPNPPDPDFHGNRSYGYT